ncbi:MAG TPA: photosynthetic reaction center cytochrome c subunit family protein [Bryobacteraceae bacterium]|jgi:photosynthetic reaction center cytochrome c subunit|nr:photosynthetic reaction center cytochrome c subunit family protein [Bryobacteraceae bacterium]
MRLGLRVVLGVAAVAGFSGSQEKPQTADQVFKNVQVLKGIPVDDFMDTMGLMSASVGYDCSECHIGAGTDKVNWAADNGPKIIARRMVTMVAAINKDNFQGRQVVTCWSCHHGRDRPSTTPAMEVVYGPGLQEMDDTLTQMPGQPSADVIINKYLEALGGEQKLAALKSYVGTGTSVGFGGFGGGGQVHIFAKYPDQRTTLIQFAAETGRGDEVRSYNGKAGWMMTPLAVLTDYQLTGVELDGAMLDAELGFPGQIKKVLTNLRVSLPTTISDLSGPSSQTAGDKSVGLGQDLPVNVVQGTGPRGMLATMYFDQKTGLLVRLVRYGKTQIGRVPTQIDYSDYRDAGGIKLPFHMTFAWLDGRDAIQLNEIQTNVPIDDAKFGRHVHGH